MAIASYSNFYKYKNLIQSLPCIEKNRILTSLFLLEKDEKKQLEIYYAPFEFVNEQAKIVIVGITPGLNQMKASYLTVLNAKDQLADDEEILRQVKKNSSFAGSMRKNLVQMLDELGLNKYLNIATTMDLFGKANHLVHTTSVLSYPVFYKGKNYSGSTPDLLKTDLFKKYVTEQFVTQINHLVKPLIIPLGTNVSKVCRYLAERQMIEPKLILDGFPHPSGANGNRKKQFEANKNYMKENLYAHLKNF